MEPGDIKIGKPCGFSVPSFFAEKRAMAKLHRDSQDSRSKAQKICGKSHLGRRFSFINSRGGTVPSKGSGENLSVASNSLP